VETIISLKERRAKFLHKLSECAENPEALIALGKSCFLSSWYPEAIEAYRACIAVDGANAAAYYNLGVAFQALGKYRDARDAFLKALEINPNHEAAQEALNNLAAY
jgi:tetratricopeptide (TPR) repeat protein